MTSTNREEHKPVDDGCVVTNDDAEEVPRVSAIGRDLIVIISRMLSKTSSVIAGDGLGRGVGGQGLTHNREISLGQKSTKSQ